MLKSFKTLLLMLPVLLVAVMSPVEAQALYIDPEWNGDVNMDGELNVADVPYLINALLDSEFEPQMDINQNGTIDVLDLAILIEMLMQQPSSEEYFRINGVSFTMRYISGGTFTMGADQDEYPPHEVKLHPYYIGMTEVTQELWYAVMGRNNSHFKGSLLPAEQLTWDECQEFVNRLSEITGRRFRLPSEAEWEFAARGGTRSRGYIYSGSNTLSEVGWYEANSGSKTNPVKGLAPNEKVVYDMSGNVWEWCQDWYGAFSGDYQLNPTGPLDGTARVIRGGGWEDPMGYCRVSYRDGASGTTADRHIGLRLAMDAVEPYWFALSSTTVRMEVGEHRTVDILNGNGDYTIYNNGTDIVSYSIDGESLSLTGLQVGVTTLTVVDNLTGASAVLTVIVTEPVAPMTFDVNGVEFSVDYIDGGNFIMGGTEEQGGDAQGYEKPVHYVTLSDYYIGRTEVTQALWTAVMGDNPSHFAADGNGNHPVEQVTWDECQEFVCRLSEMTGWTFRMPTEAEWEFAARGGRKTHRYKYSGSDTLDDVAWYADNAYSVGTSSSDYGTHAVATKAPNELGLYDMSGNVMEWCLDLSAAYTTDTQVNPTGPFSGTNVVGRGGGWQSTAANCRVSSRYTLSPSNKHLTRGLRVVMEPNRPTSAHFDVYERVIRLQVGVTRLVDILNGSGDYLIYNRIPDFATCRVVGEQIEVTGVSPGTDIIAVKDRQTGAVTWFTVIVKGPFALSKNELTLYVNQSDTVDIINGNGRYSVECDTNIVTASLSGDHLIIHGVTPDTTTVSVTDLSLNATVYLEVIVKEHAPAPPAPIEEIVVNDVRFNMITVQGGSFLMGLDDPNIIDFTISSQSTPAHMVTLSSYCIGETEVTQELWVAIMGSNPSQYQDNLQKPVDRVTQSSCQSFINKLNELTGKHFRLPTEAEWEFAARGGNKSRGYMYSGSDNIDEVAWYDHNTSQYGFTTGCPVATRFPNELGLYDMSGSVNEWCSDWCGTYTIYPQINPKGPGFDYRGGSRTSSATCCTVWEHYTIYGAVGLRLAMDLENDTIAASLTLSENIFTIEGGETKSTNILNGSGDYSISVSNSELISASLHGNGLSVTGIAPGYVYVTVVDNVTGERTFLTVIVNTVAESFTVNGVTFNMLQIRGGGFKMGAADDDPDAASGEKPLHTVHLDSYRLGQTEVTQELWEAVMGNNPSNHMGNPSCPVENVSWIDCQKFIFKLNQLTGLQFRLPTEAEWEFAAKDGFLKHSYKYAGSDSIDDVAWYTGNADGVTHPVMAKQPNALGLYDMSGNVEEWCLNWSGETYTSDTQMNPTGPTAPYSALIMNRISRGGNYSVIGNNCRTTYRISGDQRFPKTTHGLRLALDMDDTPKLHFSESVLIIPYNELRTVEIVNGTGTYTIAGGNNYVIPTISGNSLTVEGIAIGGTTLYLTDTETGYTAILTVIVDYGNPPEHDIEEEIFTVNGVPFSMITVDGGTFRMGRAEYSSQSPVHKVTLTDYKIGKTEVTQALWQAVMGSNPSYFPGNSQRPVELVSWEDCQEFIYKLNRLTGKQFRLPTEAEWEFAARGGNYSHGYSYAGSDVVDDVAWYKNNASDVGSDSPDYGTHTVATKLPNELGIYDMTGNVAEWCFDCPGSYTQATDPIGSNSPGSYREIRESSWASDASIEFGSVTTRNKNSQAHTFRTVGLRLALDVEDSPKFRLSESVVIVRVGETKTTDILNGTGSYSVSGGTTYATPKISNGRLNITGKAIGTTSLYVSSKAAVSVIVVPKGTPDDLVEFEMEDWEGCEYVNASVTENDVQGHRWKWDFSDAYIRFLNNSDYSYHGKLVCNLGVTNSSIAMAEDFVGHTRALSFFSCLSQLQTQGNLRVDYSTDEGQTWTSLGTVVLKRYVLPKYYFPIEVTGNVRFRFVVISGGAIIDDIAIYY